MVVVAVFFFFFLQKAMADPSSLIDAVVLFCILVVSGFVLYVPSRIDNFVAVDLVFELYYCLVRSTVDVSSSFLVVLSRFSSFVT